MNIIYEDNHILVVYKKANLPSQADSSKDVDILSLAKEYIKEKYKKPGNVYLALVQRLDRPVEGLMVLAKTSKAAARLSKAIANQEVKKRYYAIVWDENLEAEAKLEDYLYKDEKQISRVVEKSKGKYSELSYKKLASDKALSLLDIDLKTGRHHQIRVQLASRNSPIYGDQRYGKQDKKQIALFAYYLFFIHPVTKKEMYFISDDYENMIFDKFKNEIISNNKSMAL